MNLRRFMVFALIVLLASSCLPKKINKLAKEDKKEPENLCLVVNPLVKYAYKENGEKTCTNVCIDNKDVELVNNNCQYKVKTRECVNRPTNSIGGSETSIDNGLNWSSCYGFTCLDGYSLTNSQCIINPITRSCKLLPDYAQSGTETSNDNGKTYQPCMISKCADGFTMSTDKKKCNYALEIPNYNIQYYVEKFNSIYSETKINPNVNIEVKTDNTLASNVLGTCVYAAKRFVLINEQYWNSPTTNNTQREYIVFHELGHCVLDRTHLLTTVQTINTSYYAPVSIMYPSLMYYPLYRNNQDYYRKELFDSTIQTQNVEIRYANAATVSQSLMSTMDTIYNGNTYFCINDNL